MEKPDDNYDGESGWAYYAEELEDKLERLENAAPDRARVSRALDELLLAESTITWQEAWDRAALQEGK